MYSSSVLNNWLCVNLSRLWVFFFGGGGILLDQCHELKQEVLVLPQSHCYDSGYYSLPASKLLGNSEKILVKKRCPYSNVLILSCFVVVLLPVILYLMYTFSSFPKIQILKSWFWVKLHSLLLHIHLVLEPDQILTERIERLDCVVFFWFWNSFCVGVCVSWTIVLIKTVFQNLSGFWNRFPQMAVEIGRIFVDGVPMTSLLHLG